ncbi:MAG TPA: hypothetical protein VFY93_16585 [Planctomycetota bacterium]|nr:hypothetical protein [Planctomycetota bacterium]
MRPWFLACLLAACGGDARPAPPSAGGAEDAMAGFARWPADTVVLLRLPSAARLQAAGEGFAGLLRALGREATAPAEALYGIASPDGLARKAPPYAALTASGGWMRVLPASDMPALRRSLAPGADVVAQETDDRLVLFRGTLPGNAVEAPLPGGDVAIRVRHHPLLAAVAESGDVLEAAIDVGGAGFDARARLVPGPDSPTRDLLARAVPGEGGLLDYLPPTTFLRVETTLEPVFLAAGMARRLARHLGAAEAKDRTIVVRVLREALSGADPATGLAIGVEARGGEASVVVIARDAEGAPSPILKKLCAEERSTYGALVLDRRASPAGHGWFAWVAHAAPALEDLPECLWSAVDLLSDEAKGLPVAYAAFDGWSVVAFGPRADALAVATRERLTAGSSRTAGADELRRLRESRGGDYVFGVVVEPGADLPAADLRAAVASLGGIEGAPGAKAFAAAGFRTPDALEFLARAYY